MRLLGLDVGAKTIGVAVTDELELAAHGVTTLVRKGTARDVEQVAALAKTYATDQIVVGLPLEEDGRVGHRAERVRVFVAALQQRGFTVMQCDERFSTVEAEEQLLDADLSRKKRKRVIDRVAAVIILERWLAERAEAEREKR